MRYTTGAFFLLTAVRDGSLIAEFSPRTKPYDKKIILDIESALKM